MRLLGVDALDPVTHAPHAVRALERVVWQRDVGQRLAAAEHQVRQRAGHEGRVRLDQRDVDVLAGQQAQVLRGGRTAVAAADDDARGPRPAPERGRGAAGQLPSSAGGSAPAGCDGAASIGSPSSLGREIGRELAICASL